MPWTSTVFWMFIVGLLIAAGLIPAYCAIIGVRTLPNSRIRRVVRRSTYCVVFCAVVVSLSGNLVISAFLLAILLHLLLGPRENYPFSLFPMFSRIGRVPWSLRVEDERGQQIPLNTNFGVTYIVFKKRFTTELWESYDRQPEAGSEYHRREAARNVALFLQKTAQHLGRRAEHRCLRISRVEWRAGGGRITEHVELLSEVPLC